MREEMPEVSVPSPRVDSDHEPLPYTAPDAHHHMSDEVENKDKLNLSTWLRQNQDDIACKVSRVSKVMT